MYTLDREQILIYQSIAHLEDNSPCLQFVPYDKGNHGLDYLLIGQLYAQGCYVSEGGGYQRGRGMHYMNLAYNCFVSSKLNIDNNSHVRMYCT